MTVDPAPAQDGAKRLKLLYILPDGHPTFRPNVAALFGIHLPREGVFSDIVTRSTIDDPTPAPWAGGEALVAPRGGGKLKSIISGVTNDLKALGRLKRGAYDAIQVRDRVFVAPLAMLLARLSGTPFIYWMSFPISESRLRLAKDLGPKGQGLRWLAWMLRGHLGTRLLYKWIMPHADFVVVQSEQMTTDVAAQGVDPAKMYPVPMGIDPARFAPIIPKPPSPYPGRRVIAYLGVCSRIRRIEFLLDVVAKVRQADPSVMLLLVGGAEEEQDEVWLREQIAQRGLEADVVLTGWLPPQEVQARMACAEVALALMAPDPLLNSTSPTKLVEYLAMGLPVVANEHPEQKLVIDHSGAGLCTPFDAGLFADAVTRLLAEPDTRAAMAERGPAYAVRERAYSVIAQNLAATYRARLG